MIKENQEAQNSAESMRKQENTDYVKEKAALEQGIENLAHAVQVLGDATSSKGVSHLSKPDPMRDSMVETKMLTVVAGVRSAMSLYAKHNDASQEDFAAVKSFLSSPLALLKTDSPHKEEYSTQSGAIQGMLKDMHDSFKRNLADAIETEGKASTEYNSLMDTKRVDMNLLVGALDTSSLNQGNDAKSLADNSQTREETQKQLKTDEEFLETTKQSCKDKANEWSERSRLRTEELSGIQQATDILTSEDAQSTFATADTSFIQTSVVQLESKRVEAYNILKQTAAKTDNVRLAMIAAKVSSGATWHFNDVIEDIEKMIEKCRDEEKADIEHKDWCIAERADANNQNEKLEEKMGQLQAAVARRVENQLKLTAEIEKTRREKVSLEGEMSTALELRNQQNADFKAAMKADADSVALIGKAMVALTKFYQNNAAFLDVHSAVIRTSQDPAEYSTSEDDTPAADFSSATSSSSENNQIVSLLDMIKQDMEGEIKTGQAEEKEAEAAYRKLLAESQESYAEMDAKVVDLEGQHAEQQQEINDLNEQDGKKSGSKGATDQYLADLSANCDWIMAQFTPRQEDRKEEMAGLDRAKAALAGMKPSLVSKSTKFLGPNVSDELRELEKTEKQFGYKSFLQA